MDLLKIASSLLYTHLFKKAMLFYLLNFHSYLLRKFKIKESTPPPIKSINNVNDCNFNKNMTDSRLTNIMFFC